MSRNVWTGRHTLSGWSRGSPCLRCNTAGYCGKSTSSRQRLQVRNAHQCLKGPLAQVLTPVWLLRNRIVGRYNPLEERFPVLACGPFGLLDEVTADGETSKALAVRRGREWLHDKSQHGEQKLRDKKGTDSSFGCFGAR